MGQLEVFDVPAGDRRMRIESDRWELALKRVALRKVRKRSEEQLARRKQINQLIERKIPPQPHRAGKLLGGVHFCHRPVESRSNPVLRSNISWTRPYAIAIWFSFSGSASTTFVRSRTFNASSILIVRSNVIPKYSLRSSLEICDSCTSSRLARSR